MVASSCCRGEETGIVGVAAIIGQCQRKTEVRYSSQRAWIIAKAVASELSRPLVAVAVSLRARPKPSEAGSSRQPSTSSPSFLTST